MSALAQSKSSKEFTAEKHGSEKLWILTNPLDEYEHIRRGLDINPITEKLSKKLIIKDMLRHRDTMVFENIKKTCIQDLDVYGLASRI